MRDYARIQSDVNKNRLKDKKINSFIFLLIGLVLLILLILFGINLCSYYFQKEVIASFQTLNDEFETTGILIRDEHVNFASQNGEVKLYLSEGEKVSTGNHIGSIANDIKKDNLYNYKSGIISYKIDGLERTLRTDEIKSLTYSQFMNLKGKINKVVTGDNVNLGRPIFKIVDNFEFYVAVLLSQDKLKKYEVGSDVQVLFSEIKGECFKGEVNLIITDSPQNIMIIKFNKFIPELLEFRKSKVKIIRERYNGIVLPNDVLVERDDKVGVMVSGYTRRYFEEVKVVGEVGDKVIIKGVSPGVKVVRN